MVHVIRSLRRRFGLSSGFEDVVSEAYHTYVRDLSRVGNVFRYLGSLVSQTAIIMYINRNFVSQAFRALT